MSEKQKIFCIGLSRTGTTSVCGALEILGYRTLHMSLELFVHPEIITDNLEFKPSRKLTPFKRWRRNKELKAIKAKFDPNLFENFDAFGDLPFPLFFKELDAKFPNSKFIYTYRDEQKWLKSMKWLYDEGAVLWNHGLIDDELKFAAYNSYDFNPRKLLHKYYKHHQDVKEFFKSRKEDLLLINIDEKRIDFDLICSFLEKDTPNKDFPVSNETRFTSRKKRFFYKINKKFPLLLFPVNSFCKKYKGLF